MYTLFIILNINRNKLLIKLNTKFINLYMRYGIFYEIIVWIFSLLSTDTPLRNNFFCFKGIPFHMFLLKKNSLSTYIIFFYILCIKLRKNKIVICLFCQSLYVSHSFQTHRNNKKWRSVCLLMVNTGNRGVCVNECPSEANLISLWIKMNRIITFILSVDSKLAVQLWRPSTVIVTMQDSFYFLSPLM